MNPKDTNSQKPHDSQKKEHKSRKKVLLSIGAIAIFLLAAFSFLVLPAIVPQNSSPLPPFGKYDGKTIEYAANTYFADAVNRYEEQEKQQGKVVDSSSYFSIFTNAFSDTVINMAFTDEVEKSGYIVAESLVDRTLVPYFSDANGVYSQKLYVSTPASQILAMRKALTANLMYQRYYIDMIGERVTTNSGSVQMYGLKQAAAEIPFIVEMGKSMRGFDIAAFPTSEYPQQEIRAFGEANKDLFTSYSLSVITVSSQDAAKKLLKQIDRGDVLFDDAAKEISIKYYADDSGKLVNSYYYQLRDLITAQDQFTEVTSLQSGAVSGVVKTDDYWSIFRCDGAPMEPDFDNQTVINAVYSYMRANEASKIESYFMDRARDFAAAATRDGFDAACREFGITKTTTTDFPLNYGNSPFLGIVPVNAEPVLAGAQTNEQFLKTAFSLRENELSAPILLGQNVVVMKLVSQTVETDSMEDAIMVIYPYYIQNFDASAIQSFFLTSKKVENNVLQVYLTYFLKPAQ